MRITRHPHLDLTGALEDTPPSADTIRKAGTLAVRPDPFAERSWIVTGSNGNRSNTHTVHLTRNAGLCDCEAARHGRVCSHILAVVAHTGWTPPERPKITVPEDPFEGLV